MAFLLEGILCGCNCYVYYIIKMIKTMKLTIMIRNARCRHKTSKKTEKNNIKPHYAYPTKLSHTKSHHTSQQTIQTGMDTLMGLQMGTLGVSFATSWSGHYALSPWHIGKSIKKEYWLKPMAFFVYVYNVI